MSIVQSSDITTYMQVAGFTLTAAQSAFLTLMQPMIEAAVQRFVGYEIAQATYTEYHPERPPQPYLDGDDLVVGWEMVGGTAMPRLRGDRSGAVIQLRRIPARVIVSVYENPAAWGTGVADGSWPTASLVPTNTYYIDESEVQLSWTGQLYRFAGVWSQAHRSVQVTYTAGLTAGELAGTSGNSELMQAGPVFKIGVLMALQEILLNVLTKSKFVQMGAIFQSFSIPGMSGSIAIPTPETYVLPKAVKQLLEDYINYSRKYGR